MSNVVVCLLSCVQIGTDTRALIGSPCLELIAKVWLGRELL